MAGGLAYSVHDARYLSFFDPGLPPNHPLNIRQIPPLAVAALRATPARLTADLELLGLLFESMVIRDLRVYAQAADAEVYHYREKEGLEVAAVVEAADGRWAAFEIKLGERWVEGGAKSLRKLARRMEQGGHERASALAVIVPQGYGTVGTGEVGVIPIGALGP